MVKQYLVMPFQFGSKNLKMLVLWMNNQLCNNWHISLEGNLVKKTGESSGERKAAASADIPEYLRPREYGKKEYRSVDLRSLIRVSQQRGVNNPAYFDIKESIANDDIINPPDIAYLRRESLESYLNFINKVWGDEHDIDQFEPDEDGYYHLVIAGHTRVEAMIEIEDERLVAAIEQGYDISEFPSPTIHSKIYRDLEPEEILALQMGENLHEKPSQERTALAMVETFYYGLETGKWSTKTEFLEANKGKFSRDSLNKALLFADLSEEIRGFVFAGVVAYGPIVELARTVSSHRSYILKKFFGEKDYADLSDEERAQVEETIMTWNASQAAYLQSKKLNVTAAKKRYSSYRKNWDDFDPKSESEGRLFSDPSREWRDYKRHVRDKLLSRVGEVAALPVSRAIDALQLYMKILQPKDPDELGYDCELEIDEDGLDLLGQLESGVRGFEDKVRRMVRGVGEEAVKSS